MCNESLVDQWAATIPGEQKLNKTMRRMAQMLLEERLPQADSYQAEKLVRNFTEHLAQLHELMRWKQGISNEQLEEGKVEREEIKHRQARIRRQLIDHMRIVRERYETFLAAMPGVNEN